MQGNEMSIKIGCFNKEISYGQSIRGEGNSTHYSISAEEVLRGWGRNVLNVKECQ